MDSIDSVEAEALAQIRRTTQAQLRTANPWMKTAAMEAAVEQALAQLRDAISEQYRPPLPRYT